MRIIATVLGVTVLVGLAAGAGADGSDGCSAGKGKAGRRIERTIEVAGTTREFILDVPSSVTSREPVPLLFDFHGFGHSGAGVWKVSAFKDLAEKERFITVYPTGLPITIELLGRTQTGPGWQMQADDNRDIAFTLAVLREIERDYCIDRNRVYSTGFSNGAFFSNLLGCTESERFAAVAPVAGAGVRGECRPQRPVPVMIHHGTADELISVERARASRDQWLAANGCSGSGSGHLDGAPRCERNAECRDGAVVVYCEEDFAHRWPPQATERIWTFLKAHSLGRERDPG